jgi:hypothetical protein
MFFFGFGIKMSFVQSFKEHIAPTYPPKIVVQMSTIVNKATRPPQCSHHIATFSQQLNMVEEENLKNLVLVEGDLKDGESDLDERYTPPLPYEGIGDNVKDAGEDGIATPKQ